MNSNSSRSSFIALGLLMLCAVAVVLGMVRLYLTSAGTTPVSVQEPESGTFLGGTGNRLAYIKLNGMIIENMDDSSFLASESSAVKARKLLYLSAEDPNVKGVLIRINSPGGTVGMSQELYQAVLSVKKEKPVVVSMGDVAASGAYYTASAADKIVANPGTLTASIGVILQSINVETLLKDKLGVKTVTVKSGKFKDILSPYRAVTDAELSLLQDIIDSSYKQFLNDVIKGRTENITDPSLKNKRINSIKAIADGRVVIGEEAVKVGLVDSLGGFEDAKKQLQEMAAKRFDISDPKKLTLQEYETPFDFWQFLGLSSQLEKIKPEINLGGSSREIFPASLRYANQPLWLMEGSY